MKTTCRRIRLLGLAGLWMMASAAWALDASSGVTVQLVEKAQSSWDGQPLAYPAGQAEVTAMRIDIAPGAVTGWHLHPVPSFAYVLQGELEVSLRDGAVKRLKAGDVLFEVVGTAHNGRNVGDVPVQLMVFYAGAVGEALTQADSHAGTNGQAAEQ